MSDLGQDKIISNSKGTSFTIIMFSGVTYSIFPRFEIWRDSPATKIKRVNVIKAEISFKERFSKKDFLKTVRMSAITLCSRTFIFLQKAQNSIEHCFLIHPFAHLAF